MGVVRKWSSVARMHGYAKLAAAPPFPAIDNVLFAVPGDGARYVSSVTGSHSRFYKQLEVKINMLLLSHLASNTNKI